MDAFTPIHDDPYIFGQIAAANSVSDIYAMGAEPFLALNVCGFPRAELAAEVLAEILRGGSEKATEAGVSIGGGHTMDSPEPYYGMAVLGRAHPDRIITNAGARPGDLLILTKPLGSGIIVTAMMAEIASAEAMDEATAQMVRLNRDAARAMAECGASAATDVTGFGLIGHAREMAAASGLTIQIEASAVPLLAPAVEYAKLSCVPGGLLTNLEWYRQWTDGLSDLPEHLRYLVADPQTSGGLLIAIGPSGASEFLGRIPGAAVIGRALEGPPGRLRFALSEGAG